MAHVNFWQLRMPDKRMPALAPFAPIVAPYLAHAPLTATLVRLGAAQRVYLALAGCAGCAAGRCVPGCRAALLGRALSAAGVGEIIPVGALAARPYRRFAIATPTRSARPLTDAALQEWDEARLVVHWPAGSGPRLACGVTLLVGRDGPEPARLLREHGWRAYSVHPQLARAIRSPVPHGAWPTGRWCGAPFLPLPARTPLLLPAPPETVDALPPAPQTAASSVVDTLLATWLATAIDHSATLRASPPEPPVETATEDATWPAGPGGLTPAALGALIPRLLAEPSFRSERPGQSGITKGRLAGLRDAALTEAAARALMVWLDRAGVLAPPANGQSPWRAPRTFALDDLAQLAARLRATPLPSPEEVRAAYGGDL